MGSTMDETYGAMLIGVLFATFFQGILTLQTYIYYESFPDDRRRLKLLVATVWLLDTAHLVLICQSCYYYLVTNWGNNAALAISTRGLDLHLIFIGLATILCQGFFLHRIWKFSHGNWLLTGILSAACLADFGVEVGISGQIVQVPLVAYFSVLTGQVIALFAIGAGVDIAIALVLLYYLQQGKGKTHFDSTSFVIAQVMHYTVATGLITSVLAVGCLIAFLIAPQTFVFIAMHFSLGRLYTNALLATLNSRRGLRKAAHTGPIAPSFAVMTTRVVTTVGDDGHEYQMTPRSSEFNVKEVPATPTTAEPLFPSMSPSPVGQATRF